MKFSNEERAQYEEMEQKAQIFYCIFKQTVEHITSHYLRLTQMLVPLRIACSGGQVPLHDETEDGGGGDDELAVEAQRTFEDEEHGKSKKQKEVKFSDFASTSKLVTLVSELKRVREKDPTGKQVHGYLEVFASHIPFSPQLSRSQKLGLFSIHVHLKILAD